jgi:hypothetical protein
VEEAYKEASVGSERLLGVCRAAAQCLTQHLDPLCIVALDTVTEVVEGQHVLPDARDVHRGLQLSLHAR